MYSLVLLLLIGPMPLISLLAVKGNIKHILNIKYSIATNKHTQIKHHTAYFCSPTVITDHSDKSVCSQPSGWLSHSNSIN